MVLAHDILDCRGVGGAGQAGKRRWTRLVSPGPSGALVETSAVGTRITYHRIVLERLALPAGWNELRLASLKSSTILEGNLTPRGQLFGSALMHAEARPPDYAGLPAAVERSLLGPASRRPCDAVRDLRLRRHRVDGIDKFGYEVDVGSHALCARQLKLRFPGSL